MANNSLMTVEHDGITAKADPEGLNDWELFEAFVDEGIGSATGMVRIARAMFAPDELARVKAEVAAAHGGRLTLDDMVDFVNAAIEQVQAAKN